MHVCVRLSVRMLTVAFIDLFSPKVHGMEVKSLNCENEFVGAEHWTTLHLLCPKNCPKRGVNRHFPAKTEKLENCNISVTSDQIITPLAGKILPVEGTSWVVQDG